VSSIPAALIAVPAGVIGLVIGSFLNVVVHRLPRGESIVRPRSHCPGCQSTIRPRDEVPVVSWLLLRGRCRDCSAPIGGRYPLVELLTSAIFVVLALRFGASAALPAYLYLGAVGVALAVIDFDTKRLPDVLTLPSYGVGLALLGLATLLSNDIDTATLVRGLIGLVAMWTLYLVLRLAYPQGMGFGDVKLAGVLGLYTAFLGWGAWTVGLFAGFFLGGIVSIGLVLAGRAGRKSKIPYGPFMLVGALVAVVAGQSLASAYLALTVS
jgi:leader peptidase (prepilin peptidase)/N-methyltransferase